MTEVLPDDFAQLVKDEPKSSAPWMELIVQAERAFQDYNDKADTIDRLYADMNYLGNVARDREYALFWSNVEVLKPSIYARPPVPVVTPKFKDRRPVYRTASEFLERCCNVGFDLTGINDVMLGLRDDLAIVGRGVAWVRYETKAASGAETERICVEWKHRRDFVHEPSRSWPEVGWGAVRAWMTLAEMVKRFPNVPRETLMGADFQTREGENGRNDTTYNDTSKKAPVWEIWHKAENKVVWVTAGVLPILDEGEPHLKLEGFFPWPKPAYATCERSTLVPVPDVFFYKDQLEEINELTARIHSLSAALQVRGFYPAGSGELGDAIESALAQVTNDKVLVGISNWAAFGGGAAKDSIVWLPTDMVATTIVQCVELRRQMIEDVYQIMGISDIQRGATEAEETAKAQTLKNQNSSYRVRDKQNELIRIARDLVRLSAEIMAEKFAQKTLLEMSQMEMPTDAEVRKGVKALESEAARIQAQGRDAIERAKSDPQLMEQAQQNPEQAEQVLAKFEEGIKGQIDQLSKQANELQEQVTIDQVMEFLRDNKLRPFVLDIETDSTIFADENAEKQRRNEFLDAFSKSASNLLPLLATMPEAAPFIAEIFRFSLGPYRGGRVLDSSIDEFADMMIAKAKQPPPPNPDVMKVEQDGQYKQQDIAVRNRELDLREQELQQKPQTEIKKEEVKVAGNVATKRVDAEAAVIREQAQLDADTQTNQQNLDAEALLEQQRQVNENARFEREQQFKEHELAVDTRLAYDQLAVTQENNVRQAEAKAKQPKGPAQ